MDLNMRIEATEKDCAILGNYFHSVVTDMKSTTPVWDDFLNKGTKLHGLLRTTTTAISAFLDSLQKIADVVTQSKGTTKDIGSILTRLCVRQKMMEAKLKQFTNVMLECLLVPLQERLDEWKKSSVQLEKDHAKEYKRATNEIRKKSNDTLRLQKKFRKGSKSDVHYQLNSMMHDVNDKFILLGEGEKSAVKNLLIEERSRACFLSSCLSPVLDVEVSMLNDVSHLQELLTDLSRLSRDPKQLPSNAEQLMTDLLNGNQDLGNSLISPSSSSGHLSLHNHTPPSSPNSTDSRKSSMCSLNSCDSRSSSSQSHNSGSFPFHHSNKSTNQQPASRLMSISSHDSGFSSSIAPETNGRSKPTSPTHKLIHQNSMGEIGSDPISPVIKSNRSLSMPGENILQTKLHLNKKHYQQNQYNNHNKDLLPSKPAFEQSNTFPKPLNNGNDFTADTQKSSYGIRDPGFFTPPPTNEDQPPSWMEADLPPPPPEMLIVDVINDLPPPPSQDYDNTVKNNDAVSPINNHSSGTDDVETLRQNFARHSTSPQYNHNSVSLGSRSSLSSGEFLTTMTLGRKNSNNSLQYSSGYSSQHSTPACSEDTIASHDTDSSCNDGDENHIHDVREYERWSSTLPRQRHHPQKTSQRAPRPASTAGFPNGIHASGPTIITTPGTATIKRKPSSKFSSVGRKTNVPMPVAPPTAPAMMTPTPPSNHYNANPNKPHLPIKRHQSEGMFVGVSSYYYNNNNSLKTRNNNNMNGFEQFGSTEDAPPPLPPRDNSR